MQKLKLPPHQQQRGNSIEKYEKNSIHKSKSKKLKKKIMRYKKGRMKSNNKSVCITKATAFLNKKILTCLREIMTDFKVLLFFLNKTEQKR